MQSSLSVDVHFSIVSAYLSAARLSVALLLNFRKHSLSYKRIVSKSNP